MILCRSGLCLPVPATSGFFFFFLSCLHLGRVVLDLIGPDLGKIREKNSRSGCLELAQKVYAEFLDVGIINPACASHHL